MNTTGAHTTKVDEILTGQTSIPVPDAPTAPPKNKGGRPKGSKNKKTNQPQQQQQQQQQPQQAPPTPTTSVEEELRRLANDYKATEPGAAQPAQPGAQPAQPGSVPPPPQPFVITGHLALIVVDGIFPGLFAFALNRYGWENTVKKEHLQLTEREVKDLEPIMDACVRDLVANPWIVLAFTLVGCYAAKIPPRPTKSNRTKDREQQVKQALEQLKQIRKV